MYNIFLFIHFHMSVGRTTRRCGGLRLYVESPPICSDTVPPLYTRPCTRFALLNTFTCVRTRAISVNYLLILIDDSNVLTVYYIIVFLLAYAFALCRSAARSTGRNVGNLIWRVIQFELDRKCFSGLVG